MRCNILNPKLSVLEIGLGLDEESGLLSFTITRLSSITLITLSLTERVVSPGKILKFTFADALVGNTLSLTPPRSIVGAVVVCISALAAGSLLNCPTIKLSVNHKLANKVL